MNRAGHSGGPLGKSAEESETEHLRRVASELGGLNSGSVGALEEQLASPDGVVRQVAAASLGALGDRNSIAILRVLLEGAEPAGWELAVHGLRQSRGRSGWLCLESVALSLLPTLEGPDADLQHAFRLLVMGRTKTMDRLFRAIDGHSRSISPGVAMNFANVAVRSVPPEMSRVMGLRLGIGGDQPGVPMTPEQVSMVTKLPLERARSLDAEAWETVQRPRLYEDVRRNYEDNHGRVWTAG